jgi:predicted enzyme related to lactoylglutathione lyase
MSNDKRPTFGNGKICYIEIPAIDIKSSAAFFQKTFGWQVRERGDGSVGFDDGVGEVSGTWTTDRKPDTNPGLMVHIMVADMTVTIETVIANGGKIVQPVDSHSREVTALFSDPAGNIFGLYQHRM